MLATSLSALDPTSEVAEFNLLHVQFLLNLGKPAKMRITLTGANGFIGGAVAYSTISDDIGCQRNGLARPRAPPT